MYFIAGWTTHPWKASAAGDCVDDSQNVSCVVRGTATLDAISCNQQAADAECCVEC